MKITIKDGKANIYTPYNYDFKEKVKAMNGTWDADDKCWTVEENAVDAVREIMLDIYGENDITKGEKIEVKIQIKDSNDKKEGTWCQKGDITFIGKTLASASSCNSGARAGKDVYYIQGSCTSSGSRKYWYTDIEEDSIIVLKNVNKSLYDKYVADNTREPFYRDIIILEVNAEKNDIDKLKAEKEALLKRLAEIEKLLDETDKTAEEIEEVEEKTVEEVEYTVIEKATSKNLVMGRAWTLAREAAKLFNGKVTNYFSICLKQAWEELKMHNLTLKIA